MTRDREFLERSLADLDAELAAGDLTERDHRRLRADYERRLRGEGPPPRPPARRGLVVASSLLVLAFAVVAGVLVARSAGRRDTGETLTGGDSVPSPVVVDPLDDDLARCTALVGGEAIDCFTAYTDAHPDDPDGFTQFGLFAISAGIESDSQELFEAGETFLGRALELDPADVTARVNLAVLLDRTGQAEEAAAECARLAEVDVPAGLAPLVELACS